MPRKPVNSNESVQYNVNYKYKSSTNKPQFVEPAKKGTASPSSRQYSSNPRCQGVKRGANECWGTCTTVVKQQYTQIEIKQTKSEVRVAIEGVSQTYTTTERIGSSGPKSSPKCINFKK